jgi:hypothetical protein
MCTFHALLHLAGLKAAGYAQPETARDELFQPEVTEKNFSFYSWIRQVSYSLNYSRTSRSPTCSSTPRASDSNLTLSPSPFLSRCWSTQISPFLLRIPFLPQGRVKVNYFTKPCSSLDSCTCIIKYTVLSSTCGSTDTVLSSNFGSTDSAELHL